MCTDRVVEFLFCRIFFDGTTTVFEPDEHAATAVDIVHRSGRIRSVTSQVLRYGFTSGPGGDAETQEVGNRRFRTSENYGSPGYRLTTNVGAQNPGRGNRNTTWGPNGTNFHIVSFSRFR